MKFTPEELNRLYQFAYALTTVEADAYDLLQTSLEKFLRLSAQPEAHYAYLRRVIRNSFIDQYRKDQHFPTVALDEIATELPDERSLERLIVAEREFDWYWPQIKSTERDILFLWAVEGLSFTEVAIELNMARGTVLSTMHRMRKRLAKNPEALTPSAHSIEQPA